MKPFASLSKAMALGLLRDRASVFFILIFPLMFLALFGALFKDAGVARATVVQVGAVEVFDEMPPKQRAALDDVLEIDRSGDRAEALEKVRDGDADAAVWEEPGGRVQMRVSAADPVQAGNVGGVLRSVVDRASIAATGQPPAYTLTGGQVEDESLEAIQYFTPGLLGWAVAMGGVFSAALGLVNWRKKRILRRLWLAPVRAGPVICARLGVNMLLAFAQTAIFLLVATVPYYGLRLTGEWWLVIPLVACGSLAFVSVGFAIGAWAKTEDAANGLAQIVVLPMAFLSGSFFPLDAAPPWVRSISEALPLKHLVQAMQDVLTRGGGWSDALPAMGILLLTAAVFTTLAHRLFRWDAT